jgi:hypothetical protein
MAVDFTDTNVISLGIDKDPSIVQNANKLLQQAAKDTEYKCDVAFAVDDSRQLSLTGAQIVSCFFGGPLQQDQESPKLTVIVEDVFSGNTVMVFIDYQLSPVMLDKIVKKSRVLKTDMITKWFHILGKGCRQATSKFSPHMWFRKQEFQVRGKSKVPKTKLSSLIRMGQAREYTEEFFGVVTTPAFHGWQGHVG